VRTQYNDIRQTHGFKNVIIANRMAANSRTNVPYPFIDEAEVEEMKRHEFQAQYLWLVIHELLGHGTGKMMVQENEAKFNFDPNLPPTNPMTARPIENWYKPGETWTGRFGDLATTVDECRCELVGACLMDNKDLLGLFGFNASSDLKPEDGETASRS
jgi:dipeptidyl-peptidase III